MSIEQVCRNPTLANAGEAKTKTRLQLLKCGVEDKHQVCLVRGHVNLTAVTRIHGATFFRNHTNRH
eukprot:5698034-Amphidinium_carterae.1